MDEGIIPDPFLLAENSHVRRCGPKGGAWEREDESEGGNPEINPRDWEYWKSSGWPEGTEAWDFRRW